MNRGNFEAGDFTKGVFRRATPFGWFVELAPGDNALLHVSDIPSNGADDDPIGKFSEGDTGNFRVDEIRERHGQEFLRLSMLGVEQPSSAPPD